MSKMRAKEGESDEECSSMESGSEGAETAETAPVPRQASPRPPSPPDHKPPLNGFMSGAVPTGLMGGSPGSPSPAASPLAPAAPSPATPVNAPLNLSINAQPAPPDGGRTNPASREMSAQPLVPQASMPQLILLSGQITQGIQGAQLLIPTSQGIMPQTILTIPLNTSGGQGVVGPPPSQPMMPSTLANMAHQFNSTNTMSPSQGLSHLMSNGCPNPILSPYQQPQPTIPPNLQQSAAALQQSALQQSALQQSALQQSALQKSALQQSALEQSALHQLALQQSALQQSALQQSALEQSSALQQSALQQSALQQQSAHQQSALQQSMQQAMPMQQQIQSPMQQGLQQPMPQPGLQQRLESPQMPPHQPQRSPQHHFNPNVQMKANGSAGSGSGASSPGSPLNTISRLAANNKDLTITTTAPETVKRQPLSPSHLDFFDDSNQPMISESRANTVDGINLDEIKEFAKAFKLRRLSLGLTQTQVGQALSITEGPAYSQSAICSALATQMYCAAQLASQQQSMYKSGQNHLTEFIGVEPSKKRKRRTSFTPQALELLNAHFERNTHPSGTEITTLAHQLGYEREVIRIWFCNKRQALKNTVRMMSKGCT